MQLWSRYHWITPRWLRVSILELWTPFLYGCEAWILRWKKQIFSTILLHFLFACLPCTMGFVNQNWNWKSKYSHFLCIREFNTSWCSTSLSFMMLKSKVNSMKTEILFLIFAIFGDFLAKIERKCWFSPITIFKTFYQRTNWVLLHSHKNGTCTI